jgi:hypothetical protein
LNHSGGIDDIPQRPRVRRGREVLRHRRSRAPHRKEQYHHDDHKSNGNKRFPLCH